MAAKKGKKEKIVYVNIGLSSSKRKISEPEEDVEKRAFFTTLIKPLRPLKPLGLGPLRPSETLSGSELIDLASLRQLLSNEKARILSEIRSKKPSSIYSLAKHLGRDFKAVRQDLAILEKFGFVKLIGEKDKGSAKKRLRPVLNTRKIRISIDI